MSSTNRSNARDNHIADYYVTPVGEINRFLNEFIIDEKIDLRELDILDPCAGGDSTHPMSYPVALGFHGVDTVSTIDIRPDSLAQIKDNYLTWEPDKKYNIIVTNPPFNIAQSIIEKALNDVEHGGYVIMLLRLNYFGSKARFPFWKENLPKYAYVHHQRMSFTDGGGTDSIEYMHCVWKKDEKVEFTKLKVI